MIRSKDEDEISLILGLQNSGFLYSLPQEPLSRPVRNGFCACSRRENWERLEIDLRLIPFLQPGLIGGKVNSILAEYGRKLGPDPASIDSAMIGGIVMNNASGMSCGVHSNSDKMLVSARIVLADGTVLDTGSGRAANASRSTHPEFLAALTALRDEVLADKELTERIRYKYSIKNVTGLNIPSLVEYEDPFEIIAHSIVGSEGTLAFLSEVVMRTVPVDPLQASAMIYFVTSRMRQAYVALRSLEINVRKCWTAGRSPQFKIQQGKTLRQCLRRSLHLQRMNFMPGSQP